MNFKVLGFGERIVQLRQDLAVSPPPSFLKTRKRLRIRQASLPDNGKDNHRGNRRQFHDMRVQCHTSSKLVPKPAYVRFLGGATVKHSSVRHRDGGNPNQCTKALVNPACVSFPYFSATSIALSPPAKLHHAYCCLRQIT